MPSALATKNGRVSPHLLDQGYVGESNPESLSTQESEKYIKIKQTEEKPNDGKGKQTKKKKETQRNEKKARQIKIFFVLIFLVQLTTPFLLQAVHKKAPV